MPDEPVDLPAPTAQGAFAKTPLAQVFVYVLERQLTGTIQFAHPDGESAWMLVLEGLPSKIKTSAAVAYLGNVLRSLGYIDDAQLNASLARMAKERRLHGVILREMGLIDEEQLLEALRVQLVQKIEHMIDWPPEATFAYFDGFDALHTYGADELVQIDPLPLVWAAIRQSPPWENVHTMLTRLGTTGALKLVSEAQIDRFGLTAEESRAAQMLGVQPMRVHELAQLKLIGAAATQLLAYCLLITKQVEVVTAPEPTGAQRVARVQLMQVAARGAVEEQRAPAGIVDPRTASPLPEPPSSPHMMSPPRPAPMPNVVSPPAPAVLPPEPPSMATGLSDIEAMLSGIASTQQAATKPGAPSLPNLHELLGQAASPAHAAPAPRPAPAPAPAPAPPPMGARRPTPIGSPGFSPHASAAIPKSTEVLEARRAEILARAASIMSQNFFEMLGLKPESTPEDAQAAFFRLAKTWHPDRVPAELVDVRDACAGVFSHLSEAHQTLADPKRRAQYMHLLKDGGATPDEQAQVQLVLEAATNFQKAEIHLRRGDIALAEELSRKAHLADPQQADYLALVTWLVALKPENQDEMQTRAGIADLDRAVMLNGKCERAYYYRGMLYKRLGRVHDSVEDFRQASELNPRNIDAVREVRLFEMRKQKGSVPPPPVTAKTPRGAIKPGTPPRGNPGLRRDTPGKSVKPEKKEEGSFFGKLFKK